MIYPNFFHGLIEGRQHCGKYKFLLRAHISARATGTSMIAGSTDWVRFYLGFSPKLLSNLWPKVVPRP